MGMIDKQAGMDRRDFLRTAALTGTGFWLAGVNSVAASKSPNQQIQFACIGVGGKGDSDTRDAGRFGKIVGLCDIDAQRVQKMGEQFKEAEQFFDFREMLDKLGDQIDAVTISTPDHTHAVAAAKALRMKKHVFCQKPLTHTIYEARLLGELARENGVATQMGNQGTAGAGLREAAEILRSGGLGTVKEVHIWSNRPVWPQGMERKPGSKPVPDHIHWDLFLGPAPERPFNDGYHPFNWRGFWDFGTGALGDMACHTMNMPFMGLDLRYPTSVEAEHSGHNGDSYPRSCRIRFEFPANKNRPALTLFWYDGGQKPDPQLLPDRNMPGSGCLIIGSDGSMFSPDDYGSQYVLMPQEKFKNFKKPDQTIPRSPGHFDEFINAIRGGDPAMSNFPDYASSLTETVLLGNLAVWSGKKVEWDAVNLVATNAPELASIVKAAYRDGWTL